jgi:hypothetical protein
MEKYTKLCPCYLVAIYENNKEGVTSLTKQCVFAHELSAELRKVKATKLIDVVIYQHNQEVKANSRTKVEKARLQTLKNLHYLLKI